MIEKLVAEYQEIQLRIVENRQAWQLANAILKQELTNYSIKFPLGWTFDENDSVENGEVLSLLFHNQLSGLHDKIQMKKPMKFGGRLSFAQLFNGEIQVSVKHPQIEGIYKKEPEITVLDIVTPQEITPNKIAEFVETFLEEMITFEKIERRMIGFK